MTGDVYPEDTVRYMMHLVPLIAVASAACIVSLIPPQLASRTESRISRRVAVAAAALVAIVAAFLSYQQRSELTRDEQAVRIQPVIQTIDLLTGLHGSDYWVFTFQPCIYQVHGPTMVTNVRLGLRQ